MQSTKLKEILGNSFSKDELVKLVRGYDVIGDIAIIIVPDELQDREKDIARAICDAHRHIRLVARREGSYSGEYRTITLKKIYGQGGFNTLHKEFGVRLKINPEEVYFSPRSGSERYRIAQQVTAGEKVLVMFSGVGPFPLMLGLHSHALVIYGIEKNPLAHLLALENLKLNRRVSNVLFFGGDVEEIAPTIDLLFDRIIMPLPEKGVLFLHTAFQKLISPGTLHFYTFSKAHDISYHVDKLSEICHECGRELVDAEVHKCGHISPGKYRICIDAYVK